MTDRLHFHVEAHASNSPARAATFQTMHNVEQKRLFMPVGSLKKQLRVSDSTLSTFKRNLATDIRESDGSGCA